MNKDEIVKMMEEKGYEECLSEHTIDVSCEGKTYYFKPKQEFPIVFEDVCYIINVNEEGKIDIINKCGNASSGFGYSGSLPLLEQALQKSKEIRSANEPTRGLK